MPAPASLNMVFIVGRSAIHPRREEPALTLRQREALGLVSQYGAVRRADLVARFGISEKTARQDLVGLVQAGLLRRLGARRGTRYVPVPTT